MMKIMKNIGILFVAFVLISTSVFGQTAKQKRAERQFNDFSFVKAINTYEKLIDTSFNKFYAMRKLGDAYIMLRQPEKALPIYKEVVKQENVPSEYYLYYAQALRANGDYEASKKWMKKFKESGNEQDLRVKDFFKNDDLASAIFNASEKNTLQKLNINTKFNEFGAVELNNEIIFSSSRDEGVSVKRLYAWDKQPLLDLYKVSKEEASVEATKQLEGNVNTIHHDGPATFNSDGTKMYFSRNNYFEAKKINDEKGIMHVGIYSADLVNGKWENIKPSNLNNPNYIVYHPSLSEDGKKLYFASDMPGGIGGTDIYVSDVLEDGTLGKPVNLGNVINTEGNEAFPFIYNAEDILYFSSDGHVGFGLMDVFAAVKGENNSIVNVINLGEPINSKKDDFAYYLSKDGFKGFISSNRKGGEGGDDIYAFTRIPPLTLKGQIFDAVNNEPVVGAKVLLTRENGEELAYFITKEDGAYEHLIPRDEKFVLKGSKEKYQDVSKNFSSFGLEKEKEIIVDLNIPMKPIENVVILADLETIYFDLDKYNIRPDAAIELDKVVALMNKYPGMVIRLESHTDSRADDDYNLVLSNNRAKSTYKYIISKGIDASRITKYEGFGETQLVNKCSNNVKCSEADHQLNRRTEFIIIKMK
ncbi:outer membrane protein OmpA-like peptidoglycan-associated protein [Lutibacter oceani]|uniref:Outer membrane protein OmpA-like peptidoglycan-associated protein n=2 Tax=Lutibacter oceani TaxID=1853311 RepID=A0A3D9RT14_9FLAO|nr:outer membrane protein OmpA-like peptidoglycan-associated protein [Lutibacter oceani]